MRKRSRPILLVLFILMAFLASGQYGSFGLTDARQLGLGNTFATNSRELYAAGKNPSLLAERNSGRRVDILFPALSARAYNVKRVSDFFNDAFSQKPVDLLTGIDGSVIKTALENGGKLYLGLQIGFLGAGYYHNEKVGAFSFVMKDFLTGYLQLPQTIVDFAQNQHFDRSILFRDFQFQSSWTRAYELSYGRVFHTDPSSGILSVYAGIGVKYLNGFLYRDIRFSAAAAYADENGIFQGTYTATSRSASSDDIDISNAFSGAEVIRNVPFMHSVGKGASFDAGITMVLDPGIKVGVSVTDLGFINWNGKTRNTLVSGIIKLDSTISIEDLDSLSGLITIEKESQESFTTRSAAAVHLGMCIMMDRVVKNFPGRMNIAVELHQGASETVENPDFPRVALGLDWKPGTYWPVFLTGLTNRRAGGAAWALGIGYELGFVELYISSPDIVSVFQGDELKTFALSASWHFLRERNSEKR